jgi:hypothetical protein
MMTIKFFKLVENQLKMQKMTDNVQSHEWSIPTHKRYFLFF